MIRVELPTHLRTLAGVPGDVTVEVEGAPTLTMVLDALERVYPTLRGTIREYGTMKRRPFVRFFAGGEDISHDDPGTPLPASVAAGDEPLMIVGAIAGG